MTNIINAKRIDQITTFLKSLNIKSKRFSEIIKSQNISFIQDFNQVFIHSSADKIINYEKLEFFGDAVLRFCLLYTSPSPRDRTRSRMPSSA